MQHHRSTEILQRVCRLKQRKSGQVRHCAIVFRAWCRRSESWKVGDSTLGVLAIASGNKRIFEKLSWRLGILQCWLAFISSMCFATSNGAIFVWDEYIQRNLYAHGQNLGMIRPCLLGGDRMVSVAFHHVCHFQV